MSNLLKRVRQVDRAVGRHLGERLSLQPMKTSEFSADADQERTGGTFVGHLMFKKDETDLGGSGATGATWAGRISITGAVLSVAEVNLPEGLNIKKNDIVTALDRDGHSFKVTRVDKRLGRWIVEMGDAG